jgi:hypothetical protein
MKRLWDKFLASLLYPFFRPYVSMPGRSFNGKLPPLTAEEELLKAELQRHVQYLAVDIGDRSVLNLEGLNRAAGYIRNDFASSGFSLVEEHPFKADGYDLTNLEVVVPGTSKPEEVLVIGAHYDTVPGTPGADDNGSGCAAVLWLARRFRQQPCARTVRFVAFSREETHDTQCMGSYAYAKRCRERGDKVLGMLSLEMLGVYSDEEGSQKYPWPFKLFYPTKGNFIGFVGSTKSADFVRRCVGSFRKGSKFPCEGVAAPDWVKDATRSDHLGFWLYGYPGLMITDTSNFRFPLYHTKEDTPDKLNFDRFAQVVAGLERLILDLGNS